MTVTDLMNSMKSKAPAGVVLAMPKTFGIEAVVASLESKITEAEAAVHEAQEALGQAALDELKGIIDAVVRKEKAAGELKTAQDRLHGLLAARSKADAERRDDALRERHAKEEAEDAEALRAGGEYIAAVNKWIELAPEIGKAWKSIVHAEWRFINRLQISTPRLRKLHDVIYNVDHLALLEVARTAPLKEGNASIPSLPYGMPAPPGACTSKPFSQYATDIRIVLERELATAAAARAKARK